MYHVLVPVETVRAGIRERPFRCARAALLAVAVAALATPGCAGTAPEDRAMAMVRRHDDAGAIRELRAELGRHPDNLRARRLLVRVLAASGDLAGARAEVAELEKRSPDKDPTPLIELGHAYELAHRFEEALAAYDDAAALAPTSPLGPREGGMRAARWGEVEVALPRLEEAVRRGATDPETFHALGLVRLHSGDPDGAAEAYQKGLDADAASLENWLGLATVAIARKDWEGALRAYDAIAKRRPRLASAELGRAYALAKLGRRDDARRALDRAVELGAPADVVRKQRAALDAP